MINVDQKLKRKRHINLITMGGAGFLFNRRMVYSYLVAQYRYSPERLITVDWIADGLCLNYKVAKACCQELVADKLAEIREGRFIAKEPSQEQSILFRVRHKSAWEYDFCGCRYYLRNTQCPLTNRQNAVYWLCVSLAKGYSVERKIQRKVVANMLCIDEHTVSDAWEALHKERLMNYRGNRICMFELLENQFDWYRDAEAKRERKVEPLSLERPQATEQEPPLELDRPSADYLSAPIESVVEREKIDGKLLLSDDPVERARQKFVIDRVLREYPVAAISYLNATQEPVTFQEFDEQFPKRNLSR